MNFCILILLGLLAFFPNFGWAQATEQGTTRDPNTEASSTLPPILPASPALSASSATAVPPLLSPADLMSNDSAHSPSASTAAQAMSNSTYVIRDPGPPTPSALMTEKLAQLQSRLIDDEEKIKDLKEKDKGEIFEFSNLGINFFTALGTVAVAILAVWSKQIINKLNPGKAKTSQLTISMDIQIPRGTGGFIWHWLKPQEANL